MTLHPPRDQSLQDHRGGPYSKLVSLVEQLDRNGIRAAIEHAGIVTAAESTLFELLTTFYLLDALKWEGWQLRPFHLFEGRLHVSGHHVDGRPIDFWYQATPAALGGTSRYRNVLKSHAVPRRQLRPDMVLRWTSQNTQERWLLVECKLSESRGAGHAVRAALLDLLAYRRSFDATLTTSDQPYGLGVAWGQGLFAVENAEVALCTPDALHTAVHQIVT